MTCLVFITQANTLGRKSVRSATFSYLGDVHTNHPALLALSRLRFRCHVGDLRLDESLVAASRASVGTGGPGPGTRLESTRPTQGGKGHQTPVVVFQ